MKKRRIVAFALAATMVFSSFSSVTFADETVVSPAAVEATAEDVTETDAADDAVSDSALTANAAATYMVGGMETNVAEDGEWKATVTGDAGAQERVSGLQTHKSGIPYYSVIENDDDTVKMSMGIIDDNNKNLESVGKISSTSDGLTLYYKELKASDNFELSATAKVKKLINTNNQVTFGLVIRDEIQPMINYSSDSDMVVAGPLMMNNIGKTNGLTKGFYRTNGTLVTAESNTDLLNEVQTRPEIGDVIDLKIKKNGNVITLYYGDQKPVVLFDKLSFTDDIYAGLCVVRNAEIEFSNISFNKIEDKYTSINIVSEPDKTLYILGDDLDTTGLRVEGTLPDGSKEYLSADQYDVVGYNENKNNAGNYSVSVVCGSCVDTFDVSVEPLMVTSIKVTYPTAKNVFYTGSKFSRVGLVVTAEYNNGKKETLDADKYILKMDGEVIDDSVYFTDDMVGNKTITVEYTDQDPNILPNGKSDSFNIKIEKAEIASLYLASLPAKTTYYLNDEFESAGMVVRAEYNLGETSKYQALLESEYTVEGFDSSKPADKQTLTVVLKKDPTITVSFDITVKERRAVATQLTTYPRTTFHVGEQYDAKGMVASKIYDSEDIEEMDNSIYYYFDGSRYYTTEEPYDDAVAEADGTYTIDSAFMTNAETAPDYYIDLSDYDNSKVGNTQVSIVFRDFDTTVLNITIEEKVSYIWKPAIFGSSSMGFPTNDPPTGPAEIYVNGTMVDSNTYDQSIGFMENGKLTNVNNVRINAWDKAGKTSTGVDGLAYYYTRVSPDNNFTLSADIQINRYIVDPDDPDDQVELAKTKAEAEELLGRTITMEEAIDMSRDGQENFGLQAMDAISLFAKDGLGDDNLITADANNAQLDKYGEPINIWEAYLKGMTAVDYRGDSRKVNYENVAGGFASNLVLAGGYSGATYSRDITAPSYYKNTHLNRINLMVKKGITDYMTSTGGNRMDPYNTTDTVPLKNEKYNITLQRINYGYKITTYNYQTGETRSNYAFDTTDGLQDLLVTQADKDNIWVGFYAARWADINVSNIELYETSITTDPIISTLTDETYSPKISVESSLYTSSCDYNLVLKANNRSGGLVNIRQGDVEVYTDMPVTRKATSYPITLEPDSKTEFTVTYTPSRVDNCVSYEPVVERFTVTNKALDAEIENLYVSPDGSVKTGDGTRENPIDLESAIGLCEPGQKIIMLDGTYNISDKITIPLTNTGTSVARKYLVADEGAEPVIDLRKLTGGFTIAGYYWVFDGITICNAAGNTKAFELGGNHVIVENCTFRDNGDTGLQISRVDSADLIEDWPGYNLVKNCESFNNADPSKNNADGFAAKLTSGYGNIFKSCIAHHNVDDGWDLYTKLATGAIGPVTLEDCVAYAQGYELYEDGTDGVWGDPDGCNGFKTGGENISVMHYLKDSITFGNIGSGIDSNFNPALKARNVISYQNQKYNVALYSALPKDYSYDMKGVVSYEGRRADRIGTLSYNENITYTNGDGNDSIHALLNPTNYFIYGFNDPDEENKGTINYKNQECWTNEDVFNSHFGFKNYVESGSKLTYETLKALANGEYDLNSYNSELEMIDDSFFKSVDSSTVLTNGRYSKDADGNWIMGDFLARTTPYVHAAEDLVDYSEVEIPEETETTTSTPVSTETTTKSSSSSNGGGSSSSSGGSGSSSHKASGIASETTTAKEETTERTTVTAKSFVTPSGVVITPPVNSGIKANFTDIASRAWAVESINKLAAAGIVSGVSADKFAPDAYSKRADFIVMLVKTFGLTGTATDNFDDVAAGKYYANAIAVAKAAGIATGYGDGNFGPEKTITRQDMMVLVAKSLEFAGIELDTNTAVLDSYADAAQISDYAKPYVAALINAGLASGTDNGIEPLALITRAQMSVLIANVYDVVLDAAEAYAAAEEATEETTEDVSEETTEETTEEVTEDATDAE